VLQLVPFVAWVAIVTSVALLAVLFALGELSPRALGILIAWWGAAAYCQFLAGSAATAAEPAKN